MCQRVFDALDSLRWISRQARIVIEDHHASYQGDVLERALETESQPNVPPDLPVLMKLTSEDCPAVGTCAAALHRKDTCSRATHVRGHV